MKKILTILLTIISINLFSVEPVGFQYDFYDTLRFRKPFILQNGDTCEIFLVNDSICMKCNSGDTVRIDGTTVDLSNYPTRTELGDTADAVETRANDYTDNEINNIDTLNKITFIDSIFIKSNYLYDRGLLYLSEDTHAIINNNELYWSNSSNGYLRINKTNITGSSLFGYYGYATYLDFPNTIRCNFSSPWISYATRASSGFNCLMDGFTINTIPNSNSNWQTGMLGVLRNYTGTPISIEHSSNIAYLAGGIGRIMNEFNDNTTGGTYYLAGLIGSNISTGTARSYGILGVDLSTGTGDSYGLGSIGNTYLEGTLEVTDTLFFHGDTITDITVHNVDSASITINGNIYKMYK